MKKCCTFQPARALRSFILFAAALCGTGALANTDVPQRVASLNLCLDQMLLAMLPQERIASLTYMAADANVSALAAAVGDIPLNHGLAEELIPLQPDLILAGQYGAGNAVSMLRRLGYRVETLPLPRTLAEIRTYIGRMGELLGAGPKAAAMLAAMEHRLARVRAQVAGEEPIRALIYASNGVTVGAGTLEHELLTLAGYENVAASLGISGFAQLPLEQLVKARPQRLIIDVHNGQGFSIAREYLRHPVLRQVLPPERHIALPKAMSVCSAPFVSELVESLVARR